MSYPKKLLNDNENVVADLHPHWWHFVQPAIVLVLAIILGIFALTRDGTTQDVLGWISIILIVGSSIWLLARFISWISTNFVVTDQRVIFRTGVFAKQGIEIPLDRVNTVHFSQGVVERIVGAGDLMIESAGKSANLALKFVCRLEISSSRVGRPRACWRSVTLSLHEYLKSLQKNEL